MTISLVLALAASALLGGVGLVVLPRSLRSGVEMLPSPLRALHAAITALPLVMGDVPALGQRLRVAGRDDGPAGVRWARSRSLVYGIALATLGLLTSYALTCPPWLVPLIVTTPAALGPGLLLAGLEREAGLRQTRLRYELVELLRAVAGMVAGGLTIHYSLEVVARYRGVLHAELADALRLLQSGVLLNEALTVFAERCASDDITEVVRALQGTLTGRRTDNATLLFTMARSLETMLRQEAHLRRAQGMLKTQLAFGLLGLPPFMSAIAYPVAMMIVHTVQGG